LVADVDEAVDAAARGAPPERDVLRDVEEAEQAQLNACGDEGRELEQLVRRGGTAVELEPGRFDAHAGRRRQPVDRRLGVTRLEDPLRREHDHRVGRVLGCREPQSVIAVAGRRVEALGSHEGTVQQGARN
jgi:hypothetical protein